YALAIMAQDKCPGNLASTSLETTKNSMYIAAGTAAGGSGTLFAQSDGGGVAFLSPSTGMWVPPSDSTLKKNIVSQDAVTSKITLCRAVTYQFKSDPSNSLNHGFLAQEVEAVFPELVHTVKIFDRDQSGRLLETYKMQKSIDYTSMIPILLKAVQEQNAEITA